MVITSLRDDAMRNLRLAANSDCGGIGFRLLAYDFLQRTLLAKRISIDVYEKLPFARKKRPSHIEIAVRIQILKSK